MAKPIQRTVASQTTAPLPSQKRQSADPTRQLHAFVVGDDQHSRATTDAKHGFQKLLSDGLGPVQMPEIIEMISALEAARGYSKAADHAIPGLSGLLEAVVDDELSKLKRYLQLRDA